MCDTIGVWAWGLRRFFEVGFGGWVVGGVRPILGLGFVVFGWCCSVFGVWTWVTRPCFGDGVRSDGLMI